MLSLIAAVVLTPPPLWDKEVTYQALGGPIKAVVSDLAKLSGMRLLVEPSVESDVILVNVKNQPIGNVMNRIAECTGNRWNSENGIYRLRREVKINQNLLMERVLRYRDRYLKGLESSYPEPRTEVAKAELKILAGIPFVRAFEGRMGKRTVFATSHLKIVNRSKGTPYRTKQIPLHDSFWRSGMELVAAYLRELNQRQTAEQLEKAGLDAVGKVLVALRWRSEQLVEGEIIVVDPQGSYLYQRKMAIPLAPTPDSKLDFEPRYEPSSLTKELAAHLRSGAPATKGLAAPNVPVLSSDLWRAFRSFGSLHPTNYGLVEAIQSTFPDNVVALLPDQAIVPVLKATSDSTKAEAVWTEISKHLRFQKVDDIWAGYPNDLPESRTQRFNPFALSGVLDTLESNPSGTLAVAIDYARTRFYAPDLNQLDGALFRLLAPGSNLDRFNEQNSKDWMLARILSIGTPEFRKRVLSGARIAQDQLIVPTPGFLVPVGMNPDEPKEMVRLYQILMNDVHDLEVPPRRHLDLPDGRPPNWRGRTPFEKDSDQDRLLTLAGWRSDLVKEVTEFLPNPPGDLNDWFQCRTAEIPAILATNSRTGTRKFFALSDVTPDIRKDFDRFAPCRAREYRFLHVITPILTLQRHRYPPCYLDWAISDFKFNVDSVLVDFDSLPPEIRASSEAKERNSEAKQDGKRL